MSQRSWCDNCNLDTKPRDRNGWKELLKTTACSDACVLCSHRRNEDTTVLKNLKVKSAVMSEKIKESKICMVGLQSSGAGIFFEKASVSQAALQPRCKWESILSACIKFDFQQVENCAACLQKALVCSRSSRSKSLRKLQQQPAGI